jgi:hypothetical protein
LVPNLPRARPPRIRLLLVLAGLALALAAGGRAHAIEFHIGHQPFRLDIVESLYASYHGDLPPYLIVETDANGRPTNALRVWDILNRLNVDLAWRRLRLFTRFDTALYIAAPAGACGPDATTPFALRSRFCQIPFWPEKAGIEYNGRTVEATLGDFYVSFGRGLVLSIRKLDELGIDTTLRGGKLIVHRGRFAATAVGGFTNIQNVDEATGRYAADPNDFIAGGRGEYRIADRVGVGAHIVGGLQSSNWRDNYLMYGGTIDAPRLTRWLSLYLEGAGQRSVVAGMPAQGYALYGAVTGYAGPVSILAEAKYYHQYQRWPSSVPTVFVEFAPVTYLQPPTAERIVTELAAALYDVGGARLRVDWRVRDWLLFYVSNGYFEDTSTPTAPLVFHDPYGGWEVRWQRGASHLFGSGGYRLELNRDAGTEHQHIGHIEWDFTQELPRGLSLESQGFILFRKEELVTLTLPDGSTVTPSWTEGTAYLALKWTPYLIGTLGYEWTTEPSAAATHHFFNGAVQWNITTASSIRLFAGGNRGGLRCISGICRNFPAFSGARLEVVVRL